MIATDRFRLAVGRAIHLAHAAGADRGGDFIGAEAGAGSEGQVTDYRGRASARTRELLPDAEGTTDGIGYFSQSTHRSSRW